MPARAPGRTTVLAILFLVAAATAQGAVYDPAWTWHTLSTPHFRIHYHDEVQSQARQLADIAEEVHGPMTAALGWQPAEPTEVTVVDDTDLANGYALVVPYNHIVLYPVRPPLFSTLGEHREFLRLLFVHEYAHVLSIDPVRGYSAVTRRVFGKVGIPLTPFGALAWFFAAPPNLFLPPWFHEGLATNLETDFTGSGRKGSTLYRMIYRADVAAGSVPPLDRLGGDFPDWPSFSTRYIYGTRLLQVAAADRGPSALGELARGHSGRFPYTIDAPPRRLSGDDYTGLYRRMVAGLEAEFRPEIEELQAAGLTPVTPFTDSGYRTAGPLWLDADHLAYTRSDPYRPARLVRRSFPDGAEEVLAERPGSLTRPTLGPHGLVFSRVEVTRPLAGGRTYTDLYRLAPDGGAPRRLTWGARLLEADYSPAADRFAAVQVRDGSHRLVLLTREGDVERELLAEPGVRYDTPRWSPDDRLLAFSRKTDSGTARLALLAPDSGHLQLLTPEGSHAGFPAWHPDGSRLAFSWDRSGVFDLYSYGLDDGSLHRLTRRLGGAFEPDWSLDGTRIAFSDYGPRGYDVAVLELTDTLDEELGLATLEDVTHAEPASAPPSAPPATASTSDAPYRAWPRARPAFWLPDLLFDNQGVAPGAWTAGHDPLYRHKYYVSGFWAGQSHRFYGQALYLNDVSYPTLTAHARKLPFLHAELFDTSVGEFDYWEENRSVGLEARLHLPRALSRWSFAAGWAWEQVGRLSRVEEDLGGSQALADAAFQGRLNPLALSLLFDSTFPHSNRFTVGPEAGRRMEGIYRLRSEFTGAELDRQELLGTWGEYVALSRERHWVLALLARGGTSWGDATAQSAFQLGGLDTELPLRGYPARVARGERALSGTAELRLPAWQLYRGVRDLPLFLGKLHAAAFLDGGRTWRGSDERWRTGVGAELRADTLLGYYLPTTAVVGWARGIDRDGESQLYFTFRGGF